MTRTLAVALGSLALSLAACAPGQGDFPSDEGTTGDEAYLKNVEKTGGKSQKWIYQGSLPKLESPSVFVSLKAHTARVTGVLPANYEGQLPFYAVPKTLANGRTQVTLVYPVATGAKDPSTGKAPMGPGSYPRLFAVPPRRLRGLAAREVRRSRGTIRHGGRTSSQAAGRGRF